MTNPVILINPENPNLAKAIICNDYDEAYDRFDEVIEPLIKLCKTNKDLTYKNYLSGCSKLMNPSNCGKGINGGFECDPDCPFAIAEDDPKKDSFVLYRKGEVIIVICIREIDFSKDCSLCIDFKDFE